MAVPDPLIASEKKSGAFPPLLCFCALYARVRMRVSTRALFHSPDWRYRCVSTPPYWIRCLAVSDSDAATITVQEYSVLKYKRPPSAISSASAIAHPSAKASKGVQKAIHLRRQGGTPISMSARLMHLSVSVSPTVQMYSTSQNTNLYHTRYYRYRF
jgi:hypothetical protein